MPWYPIGSHFTAGLPAWRHGTERTSQQPAGTDAVREEPAGPAAPAVAGSRPEAGGITLELSPGAAGVYLDGSFVGHASDFLPSRGVLRLPPGVHTIELRADGYAPERFEIMATSGQLIPLAGSLQALSPGSVTAPGR